MGKGGTALASPTLVITALPFIEGRAPNETITSAKNKAKRNGDV